MFKSIVAFTKKAIRRRVQERREEELLQIEKIDGRLTDNMRALRLVATMCDQLLSRGMAASDVVHTGVGVVSTYCSRKVHIDISNTILTLSQDRGINREPLTLVRTVASRGADYHTVQLLEELGDSIADGVVTLDDAERQLDAILVRRRLYPRWVTHLSAGGVSAGVVILYTHHPLTWLAAFILGCIMSVALHRMAKMGIPSFFSQAAAGLIATLLATVVSLLAADGVIPIFDAETPTLVIIGGIVLLVAGMMIVSAMQDAIDEYYVTAAARLLKVVMKTGGIVLGVAIGLYIATRLGVTLTATPDRLSLSSISYQYLGAAVLAASFALGNQSRIIGVFAAGAVGVLSLYIVLVLGSLGIGIIASSGVAAAFVGLAATVFLQVFHVPTIATINAGIIPLVPGLTLYGGLIYVAQSTPNTTEFDTGVMLLLRAVLIAVVVAAGATFGNMIGRPARRRLIHYQNRLPRRKLSSK